MKEIPTLKEYESAQEIVKAYEGEQERLYNIRVKAFKAELTEYFANNLIDGFFELKEFELNTRSGDILPRNPNMEENYDGGNDEDIKALCEKHDVRFTMKYWCYHK